MKHRREKESESENVCASEQKGDNKAAPLFAIWQQSSAHTQDVYVYVWEIYLHFH